MKKTLILLLVLLLCKQEVPAQNLSSYLTGAIGSTRFSWPCTGLDNLPNSSCRSKEDQFKVEYPPYIIGGGWRTYFFTKGGQSSIASHPNSILSASELNFKNNGSAPIVISSPSGCPNGEPWRLEYYSAYSAQYINHPTAGTVSIGFVEGENYYQQGTGQPQCGVQDGDIATTYLCLAWTPNTQATNWGAQYFTDMGPIIWPATGYFLSNGQRASAGCANNTTIQAADGYLYVFYKDQSNYDLGVQMGAGRLPGIKVARAPISDALNPHAYQTFYEDASGIHWNQSLPAGLNTGNIQSYINGALGPQGSTLLESDRDYTRFAVAKVAGTNYYMALGNYPDPDPNKRWQDAQGNWYSPQVTTLKYSYDLLHWFGDREIYRAPNYKLSQFNYPIFLSADGWTNTSIDENNFYVLGTRPENPSPENVVYNMRLYIPPPEHAGGPIACDWYMKIADDASGATLGDIDITGNKLTVEAVFNRMEDFGNATAGGDLVSKHCNSTDANYFLRPESGGITTTDGYFQIDLPCDLERETTYHIAMVYNGAQLSIYRNGFLEASIPATGNLITNDWQTTIGTEACSSNWGLPVHFRGYINEVRIWKKARTQQQIQQFKNVTIGYPIVDPDLLAYYTFYGSGNQGSFPGGANLFGNANVYQTNPNCVQDTYGCYSLARKSSSTVASSTVSSVVVYPNPARKSASLIYISNTNCTITISVIDVTGKRVMIMKRQVIKGSNIINIELNNLINGLYSVQLIDGNKTLTKKLVISK